MDRFVQGEETTSACIGNVPYVPLECYFREGDDKYLLEVKDDLTPKESMNIALLFAASIWGGTDPMRAVRELGLERHFVKK